MTDIDGPDDVQLLVGSFYRKLVIDPQLAHFFYGLDMEHHLPRIRSFWEMILFGSKGFEGDPMTKHIQLHHRLPMEPVHFDRWLALFHATVDEHFSGPVAKEAHARATTIAAVMLHKVQRS